MNTAKEQTIMKHDKPIYNVNHELNCREIHIGQRVYLVDNEQAFKLTTCSKRFHIIDDTDEYPSFLSHDKKISYLEFLHELNPERNHYHFKNGDARDLRTENVVIYPLTHPHVIAKYDVIEYISGKVPTIGPNRQTITNPIWKIRYDGKERYIMHTSNEIYTMFCDEGLARIREFERENTAGKKLTWYSINGSGYVSATANNRMYGMHQIIMNCYGNGHGTKNISVDHIDRNPSNNCIDNLRIATRKEQEQNTVGIMPGTKKQRQHGAQALPEGITQDVMRKYVIYYKEWLNKDRTKWRDYFRVEHHPNLHPRQWESTTSKHVSIQDKLAQANKVADDLDRGILPVKEKRGLPKSIYISNFRNKPHLMFDFRDATNRYNLRMVLPENYNLNTELDRLQEKIKAKYDIDIDMTPE